MLTGSHGKRKHPKPQTILFSFLLYINQSFPKGLFSSYVLVQQPKKKREIKEETKSRKERYIWVRWLIWTKET